MYIIIDQADGSIEEKKGNKYLTFTSTNKNKEVLKKYIELWNKIKSIIEKVNLKSGEYETYYMKIKFYSDDNLPLNELLKLYNLIIVIKSVIKEDDKYYPKVFLDECLYEL